MSVLLAVVASSPLLPYDYSTLLSVVHTLSAPSQSLDVILIDQLTSLLHQVMCAPIGDIFTIGSTPACYIYNTIGGIERRWLQSDVNDDQFVELLRLLFSTIDRLNAASLAVPYIDIAVINMANAQSANQSFPVLDHRATNNTGLATVESGKNHLKTQLLDTSINCFPPLSQVFVLNWFASKLLDFFL